MIKSSALCGSAIIAYLQAKGYPEVNTMAGAEQNWHGMADSRRSQSRIPAGTENE